MKWTMTLLIVINTLLYLIVAGLWISIPGELTLNITSSIVSLLLTAILIICNRKKLSVLYESHYFKNFSSHLFSAVLIFCILGMINFFAYKNPLSWSTNEGRRSNLTAQTKEVLRGLPKGLEIKVIAPKYLFGKIKAFLELYRLQAPSISIEYLDAELRPEVIKEYGVTRVPSLVAEYEGRRRLSSELSEASLSSLLVKVTRDSDPLLYVTTGHGEVDFESKDNQGASELASFIKKTGHQYKIVDLRQVKEISKDVSMLLIWGASSGFMPAELSLIDSYLERGGRLLVGLDPNFEGDPVSEFRKLISKWGIEIRNDLVIDRLKHANGSNGSIPLVSQFNAQHKITQGFKDAVFFPLTSSVMPTLGNSRSENVELLAFSSAFPAAWADQDKDQFSKGKVIFNEGRDLKGPIGYQAIYEDKKKGTRIVAFGNSRFVSNTYRKFPKNFNLFLNSVNWIVEEDRLVSFNLPVIEERPVFINRHQVGLIFYSIVLVVPLIFFIISFLFYRRRRAL